MSEKHCIAAAQPREVITRAEAKAAGLKRYYTGEPCKHGHAGERQVSNHTCCECQIEKSARYYAENTQSALEYAARYRKANPADPKRNRENSARWRAENVEKKRASDSRWAATNTEKIRARVARWRAENPKRVRANSVRYYTENTHRIRVSVARWQAENPEKVLARNQLRRARKLQATPPWYGELDAFVWLEAAHLVVLREAVTGFAWHCDHMIPLACRKASGLHVWNNVQVIPASVNSAKKNKLILTEPGEWLQHL